VKGPVNALDAAAEPARARRGTLFSLSAVTFADAGALLLLALTDRRRWEWRLLPPWLLLLGPLALLALLAWLTSGEDRGRTWAYAVLLVAAGFSRWPRPWLWRATSAALVVVTLLLAIEVGASRVTFHDLRQPGSFDVRRLLALPLGEVRLPWGAPRLEVGVFARAVAVEGARWPLVVTLAAEPLPGPLSVRVGHATSATARQRYTGTWTLEPGGWTAGTFTFDAPSGVRSRWLWLLEVPPGAQLRLRDLQVHDADGVRLALAASPYRPELWFGGPNGVGHALAASGALAVALAPRFVSAWGVGSVVLLGLLLTGSRTAALAFLLGAGGLLATHLPWRRWWLLGLLAAAAGLVGLLVGGEGLGRLGVWSWEDRNVLWRIDQMGAAWGSMLAQPLTGGPLAELAHNFWLQQAGTLGVPGLLSALWLTGGMLAWALALRSARALGVVATVLLLQVSDLSLWFVVVMVPAMWALQLAREGEL
jgi:hypothetical protein